MHPLEGQLIKLPPRQGLFPADPVRVTHRVKPPVKRHFARPGGRYFHRKTLPLDAPMTRGQILIGKRGKEG